MKFIVLLVLVFAQAASAYDYSKKIGLGASFGYNTPVFGNHFNTEADGGQTWGLHGRYHLNSAYGLEGAFTKHEFDDTTKALNVMDVLFFKRLNPTGRFSPVLGVGAGVVDVKNYPEDKSLKLGLKLRAGAEYALAQCLSLGFNLDYQQVNKMFFRDNLDGRNIHTLAGRVGLTWYFGGHEKKAAPVVAAAAPSKKNVDSDNDGVLDVNDKCPGTPAGESVNAYGCAEEEKGTVNLNVKFASGKTEINSAYDASLRDLAKFMKEHSQTEIEIQGHTDNTGSKELNKRLSQSRADAVKNYLVKNLKVDESRLTATGYGDEQPVGDNGTAAGKQANRRVIAVISE